MDVPGVHIDAGVLLALFALIQLLVLAWIGRTTTKVHDAVNGMQEAKIAEAHAAGVAEGAATVPPPPTALP